VYEGMRGRGGAPRLVTAAEEAARALGARTMVLDTRHDLVEARALYARLGYAETSRTTTTSTRSTGSVGTSTDGRRLPVVRLLAIGAHSSPLSSFTSWIRSVGRSGPHQSPSASARDSSRACASRSATSRPWSVSSRSRPSRTAEPPLLDLADGGEDDGQRHGAALGEHAGFRPAVPLDAQEQPTRRRLKVVARPCGDRPVDLAAALAGAEHGQRAAHLVVGGPFDRVAGEGLREVGCRDRAAQLVLLEEPRQDEADEGDGSGVQEDVGDGGCVRVQGLRAYRGTAVRRCRAGRTPGRPGDAGREPGALEGVRELVAEPAREDRAEDGDAKRGADGPEKVAPEVATPRSSYETAFCTMSTNTCMTRPSPSPKTKK